MTNQYRWVSQKWNIKHFQRTCGWPRRDTSVQKALYIFCQKNNVLKMVFADTFTEGNTDIAVEWREGNHHVICHISELKGNLFSQKAKLNSTYNDPEHLSTLQSTALFLASAFCSILIVSFCCFLIIIIISIFRKHQINLSLLCHSPSLVYSLCNPK